MAYRFRHTERFSEGLERIGSDELQRALSALQDAPGPEAVHETRKCIKRLRALLRLVRPGIGEHDFNQMNARLRDASRLLSGARDRTVLAQTIERLAELADQSELSALSHLGNRMTDDGRKPEPDTVDPENLAEARHLLGKAAQSWDKLRLKPDDFSSLGAGLGHALQRCKDAFEAAYATSDPTSERDHAFHGWRKGVQQHWRHMRLFEQCWPEYAAARIAQAKELSEILGRAQDLAVLVAFVEGLKDDGLKNGPAKRGLTRKHRQKLIALARKQQHALIEAAKPRGERLLAEGTAGHVRRIELFWSTASDIEELPAEHAAAANRKTADTADVGKSDKRAAALAARSSGKKRSARPAARRTKPVD